MAIETIPQELACIHCKQTRSVEHLIPDGIGGFRRQCRDCRAESELSRSVRGGQQEIENAIKYMRDHPEMKWCSGGQHFQMRDQFAKCARLSSGLQPHCRKCQRAYREKNDQALRSKAKTWRDRTVESRRVYGAQYYSANKDRILRECKEYREANKARLKEYSQDYYRKHKVTVKQRSERKYRSDSAAILAQQKKRRTENLDRFHAIERERYWKDPERSRAKRRAHYHRNPDEHNRKVMLYQKKNKERVKVWKRRNIAKRRLAAGSYSLNQLMDKYTFHGWRCYLCGIPITLESAHAEHRIPLSRGGTNWVANIAPACAPCNLSKNNKTESEYRALLRP